MSIRSCNEAGRIDPHQNPEKPGHARPRGRRKAVLLGLAASFALTLLLPGPATAITRIWGGEVNNLWGTDGNWVPAGRPVNGDDLLFTDPARNRAMVNDISGLTVKTLLFNDGGFTIGGMGFTLTAGVTASLDDNRNPNTIEPDLVLGAAQTWKAVKGKLILANGVQLSGFALTFDVAARATIEVNPTAGAGSISGHGAVIKIGVGRLELPSRNTYTGPTTIRAGFVDLDPSGSLGEEDGSAENGTTVTSGGSLVLGRPIVDLQEALVLNGLGQFGTGSLQGSSGGYAWNAPVTLASNVGIDFSGTSFAFGAPVSGPGRLGLGGDGIYTFNVSTNTFSGGILWGAIGTADSHVLVQANDAVPRSTRLDIPARGRFQLASASNTVAGLAGAGTVDLGGNTLTVDQAANTAFSGSLAGPGLLRKTGAGELTFTGRGAAASTEVSGGVLGVSAGTLGPAVIRGGGRLALSNSGTVGALTAERDGRLAGKGAGIGNSGTLLLQSGSRFLATVFRNGPGGFSSVNVTGVVTLTDAVLTLEITGFSPPDGTAFTIIANDGADLVAGTFKDLPEGATLLVGGRAVKVSYKGGTGNDVVLTLIPRLQ